MTLTPSAFELHLGQSRTVAVVAKDASGATIGSVTITWTSSNPSIASVNALGTVSATASGTDTITATVNGVIGRALLTVTPVPVVTVGVTPAATTLYPAQTRSLLATPRDSIGGALAGRTITWSSSDTAIATISAVGLVTAKSIGGATMTATSEGKNGTSLVTVTLVPVSAVVVTPAVDTLLKNQTATLTATTKDSAGGTLTGRTIAWSSSDTTKATVSAAGLVTAKAVGGATITASIGGKVGTSAIVVTVPVASVVVTPDSATIYVGQTSTFSVTAKDSLGASIPGKVPAWASLDTAIATASNAGVATGVASGVARIVATIEGKADTSHLTVQLVPVSVVTLSPTSATVLIGGTRSFTAAATDSAGHPLTGRTFTWLSNDTTKATASAAGVVTGRAAGLDTISASTGGKTGIAVVTVTAVPVASVTVLPGVDTLYIGQHAQLLATPRDSAGNPLTGRLVTWQSLNAFVTVDSTGMVKAAGPQLGSATINAAG
ncbi:MAG: Ig-like domain-containing protein, partial [Gemmatimonadales bacterium]